MNIISVNFDQVDALSREELCVLELTIGRIRHFLNEKRYQLQLLEDRENYEPEGWLVLMEESHIREASLKDAITR